MFKVTFDGVVHDVPKSGISDLVALERKFNISTDEMTSQKRMEHTAFLLWRGLRKTGAIAKTVEFDEDFLDKIEDIEAPDDEESSTYENPTVAAQAAPAA